jgi:uncharacterized protein YeaO (DUF488 family)
MGTTGKVTVARIYDQPAAGTGVRILVDRIWPRGLRKDEVHLDEWCKTVAPSTELRKWYGHDPERFDEFARRYRAELKEPEPAEALQHLRELARKGHLTLLTASKAVDISQATVLADLLGKERRS